MDEELQGTPEWHEDRRACFTASCFSDLKWSREAYKTGERKGQFKAAPLLRTNYVAQVVAEILTGEATEGPRAKTLEYGKEMEPVAVAIYEHFRKMLVEPCGFIKHPKYSYAGASPDMLIGRFGGGEVKCPMSKTVHTITLRDGLPAEHIEQIQGGLWVTGREWWDFISYHPKFPPGLDLYVQRVQRDEAVIARIENDVVTAWDEVQELLAKLNNMKEEQCAV